MEKIKVELSSASIKETIAKLQTMKQNLENLNKEIPKELAEKTADKIRDFYNQKGYVSAEVPTIDVRETDKGYQAYITGKSVTYEEFGTGDVGLANQHPWKKRYNLNFYNSGPTIQPTDNLPPRIMEKEGLKPGMYWEYYDLDQHRRVYTQGIPPGLFMYNADNWLRDNYKDIVKKKVDDVLSKL